MFYVDGSCTTCVGTNTNECSLATCSDGYMMYSNGACAKIDCSTIDFSNVLSVVDGLCVPGEWYFWSVLEFIFK